VINSNKNKKTNFELSRDKSLIVLGLILIACLGLAILAWEREMNFFYSVGQKDQESRQLDMPPIIKGRKTVYEQNENHNFSKNKVEISSQQEGFLIAIYKDRHRLELFRDGESLKSYEVNVRREKEDRNIWEDDQTPEGEFQIDFMSQIDNGWERWIRLDTRKKAKRIYEENHPDGKERIAQFESQWGRITSDQDLRNFNQINPDQKMLRGIGIHGGGFSVYQDWTNGCVAMENEDVIELFRLLQETPQGGIGIPVVIGDY
jgi:hypothetical protein